MVRPDRDEHAWERLCARKRDEIERDTRLLSTQQQKRCERAERLYAELESAHAHTVTEENDVCEDGVLDLRGKELKVFTVPAAVERTLATRTIHTLILRNNRLQHLDARTLAPLIALVKLDVSRNELERLGPTGAVTIPGDHAKVLAAHPGARAAGVKGGFPPRLEVLLAAFNRVQKLSLGAAGAPCLKRLVVAHNVVRFVAPDIAKAPNLEELDLRGNRLSADQLKHLAPLKKLAKVKVGRNPLCADRRHGHAVPSHVRNALSTTKAPPAAPRRAWAAPAAAAARRRGDASGARPAPAPAPPSLLPRDATPASAFAASAFGASAFGAPAAPRARAPAPAPRGGGPVLVRGVGLRRAGGPGRVGLRRADAAGRVLRVRRADAAGRRGPLRRDRVVLRRGGPLRRRGVDLRGPLRGQRLRRAGAGTRGRPVAPRPPHRQGRRRHAAPQTANARVGIERGGVVGRVGQRVLRGRAGLDRGLGPEPQARLLLQPRHRGDDVGAAARRRGPAHVRQGRRAAARGPRPTGFLISLVDRPAAGSSTATATRRGVSMKTASSAWSPRTAPGRRRRSKAASRARARTAARSRTAAPGRPAPPGGRRRRRGGAAAAGSRAAARR